MSQTSWSPGEVSPRGPVYIAIADALARDVKSGSLEAGERLPTHRELARRLGLNVVTITRAYAEAKRRGLVEGEVGRGTFVTRSGAASSANGGALLRLDGKIDFHFNLPGAPHEGLREAGVAEVLSDGFDFLGAEYDTKGSRDHREAGVEWMARSGLRADPERVVVTNGAQHAMTVALTTLLDPGDTVLAEELTYPGFKALASLLHLRAAPVGMDAEGLLPDALEYACKKGNPRALYCMPTLHNPTGIVWSESRRREVLEVAERWGLTILEDDTTAFLVEDPPTPLAQLAPDRVLFLSSTSKSIGAGLRVGYLHVPACAPGEGGFSRDRLVANMAAVSWMTPPLMAELAARMIRNGSADSIVRAKQRELAARRKVFERLLPEVSTPSHPACSFVWAALPEPWRSSEFVEEVRAEGVALTPAESFVVGRAHAPHAVRVCIGTPAERSDVERGLEVLARVLGRAPNACRALV